MKILEDLDFKDVVFLNIETAPIVEKLLEKVELYDAWEEKVMAAKEYGKDIGEITEEVIQADYDKRAGLYAEFSKIKCITIGLCVNDSLKVKTYSDSNEKDLLSSFTKDMNAVIKSNKRTRFAGHGIADFDIPFIMRRCLINGLELTSLVDVGHLKPWELTVLDTMKLWQATGYNKVSLTDLCMALDLPYISKGNEKYFYKGEEGVMLKSCEKITAACNIIRKFMYLQPISYEIANIKVKEVGAVEAVYNGGSKKDIEALRVKVEKLEPSEKEAGELILKAAAYEKK